MKTKKTKKMKITIRKNSAGFLMAEAVIAIFIAGIVLTVFFSVMSKMFLSAYTQRDYIIAENYVQEGIEIVRNLRDNNLKNGFDAFKGSPLNCSDSTTGCECKQDSSDPCHIDSSLSTRFTRTITIFSVTDASGDVDPHSKKVVSEVDWTIPGSSTTKTAKIEVVIYDWGQN